MRTLVVHTGGIGDFILSLPALRRVAEQGAVELLGRPDRLELAVAAGLATAAHDIERVEFETIFAMPAPVLREFLQAFERCIVWMRDDGTICGALRDCGIRDALAFPGIPPPDWPEHASRYYARCSGFEDAPPVRIRIARSGESHDVIIHPGSGSPKKNWPLERFVALAAALRARGRSVTWCLGPAEEEWSLPQTDAVLRTDSLVELAGHLARAKLFIGNDSGITHLAAAVGCRTLAIFGPTDPHVWSPLGEHVDVVVGEPWPELERVLKRL